MNTTFKSILKNSRYMNEPQKDVQPDDEVIQDLMATIKDLQLELTLV